MLSTAEAWRDELENDVERCSTLQHAIESCARDVVSCHDKAHKTRYTTSINMH